MTAPETSSRSSSPDQSRSQGRGRSNSLPGHIVEYLKAWLMSPDHINHPYPSEKEKARMVMETGIELKRLNNWFVNNRIRYWKPRMEALQKQPSQQPTKQMQHESKTGKSEATVAETPAKRVLAGRALASNSICKTDNYLLHVAPEGNNVYDVTSKLDLPTGFLELVHEVSDASIATNDGSASSSDEDQESGRCPNVSPSPSSTYDEVVEFCSPPRRVKKRPRGDDDENILNISSPRTKYRQKDIETWKTACETSPKLHDTSLPSLDEAACLFGYSSISV